MRKLWTNSYCSHRGPGARDQRLGTPESRESVDAIGGLGHDHYPIGDCRAHICPCEVLISGATEILAAFISNKGRPPCWIFKDSIRSSRVIIGRIVFREVGKGDRAGCKIGSHSVKRRVESKQVLAV